MILPYLLGWAITKYSRSQYYTIILISTGAVRPNYGNDHNR
jgi:hypothetical protein